MCGTDGLCVLQYDMHQQTPGSLAINTLNNSYWAVPVSTPMFTQGSPQIQNSKVMCLQQCYTSLELQLDKLHAWHMSSLYYKVCGYLLLFDTGNYLTRLLRNVGCIHLHFDFLQYRLKRDVKKKTCHFRFRAGSHLCSGYVISLQFNSRKTFINGCNRANGMQDESPFDFRSEMMDLQSTIHPVCILGKVETSTGMTIMWQQSTWKPPEIRPNMTTRRRETLHQAVLIMTTRSVHKCSWCPAEIGVIIRCANVGTITV